MWLFNKYSIRGATRSPKWSSVRREFLQKNPSCAACGSMKRPEVHHIVPVHVEPLRELDTTNLITLCDKYCHFVFGHFMNWKSWNSQVIEDSMVYNKKINNRP